MLKSSLFGFCLLLFAGCATVKLPVIEEPCFLREGIYRMKSSLATSVGCDDRKIPREVFSPPLVVKNNEISCGLKFAPLKNGAAVLVFGRDGFEGKFSASDGKCTINYAVTSVRVY